MTPVRDQSPSQLLGLDRDGQIFVFQACTPAAGQFLSSPSSPHLPTLIWLVSERLNLCRHPLKNEIRRVHFFVGTFEKVVRRVQILSALLKKKNPKSPFQKSAIISEVVRGGGGGGCCCGFKKKWNFPAPTCLQSCSLSYLEVNVSLVNELLCVLMYDKNTRLFKFPRILVIQCKGHQDTLDTRYRGWVSFY